MHCCKRDTATTSRSSSKSIKTNMGAFSWTSGSLCSCDAKRLTVASHGYLSGSDKALYHGYSSCYSNDKKKHEQQHLLQNSATFGVLQNRLPALTFCDTDIPTAATSAAASSFSSLLIVYLLLQKRGRPTNKRQHLSRWDCCSVKTAFSCPLLVYACGALQRVKQQQQQHPLASAAEIISGPLNPCYTVAYSSVSAAASSRVPLLCRGGDVVSVPSRDSFFASYHYSGNSRTTGVHIDLFKKSRRDHKKNPHRNVPLFSSGDSNSSRDSNTSRYSNTSRDGNRSRDSNSSRECNSSTTSTVRLCHPCSRGSTLCCKDFSHCTSSRHRSSDHKSSWSTIRGCYLVRPLPAAAAAPHASAVRRVSGVAVSASSAKPRKCDSTRARFYSTVSPHCSAVVMSLCSAPAGFQFSPISSLCPSLLRSSTAVAAAVGFKRLPSHETSSRAQDDSSAAAETAGVGELLGQCRPITVSAQALASGFKEEISTYVLEPPVAQPACDSDQLSRAAARAAGGTLGVQPPPPSLCSIAASEELATRTHPGEAAVDANMDSSVTRQAAAGGTRGGGAAGSDVPGTSAVADSYVRGERDLASSYDFVSTDKKMNSKRFVSSVTNQEGAVVMKSRNIAACSDASVVANEALLKAEREEAQSTVGGSSVQTKATQEKAVPGSYCRVYLTPYSSAASMSRKEERRSCIIENDAVLSSSLRVRNEDDSQLLHQQILTREQLKQNELVAKQVAQQHVEVQQHKGTRQYEGKQPYEGIQQHKRDQQYKAMQHFVDAQKHREAQHHVEGQHRKGRQQHVQTIECVGAQEHLEAQQHRGSQQHKNGKHQYKETRQQQVRVLLVAQQQQVTSQKFKKEDKARCNDTYEAGENEQQLLVKKHPSVEEQQQQEQGLQQQQEEKEEEQQQLPPHCSVTSAKTVKEQLPRLEMMNMKHLMERKTEVLEVLRRRREAPEVLRAADELIEQVLPQRRRTQAAARSHATARRRSAAQYIGAARQPAQQELLKKLQAEVVAARERRAAAMSELRLLEEKARQLLQRLPNALDDSVPEGADAQSNYEVFRWYPPHIRHAENPSKTIEESYHINSGSAPHKPIGARPIADKAGGRGAKKPLTDRRSTTCLRLPQPKPLESAPGTIQLSRVVRSHETLSKKHHCMKEKRLIDQEPEWATLQSDSHRPNDSGRQRGMHEDDRIKQEHLPQLHVQGPQRCEELSSSTITAAASSPQEDEVSVQELERAENRPPIQAHQDAHRRTCLTHTEILQQLRGLTPADATTRMAGRRHVALQGPIAHLHRALGNFFLETLLAEGFTEVQAPPLIINRRTMEGTGQLPRHEEGIFALPHSDEYQIGGEDAFLIPTAEVPLVGLYSQSLISKHLLPIRLAALTPCFREDGAYGRSSKGLVRQQVFYKVEAVVICTPQQAEEQHNRLRIVCRRLLQGLEIPFREVLLCSGDMSAGAAICYDFEAWLPGQQSFLEVSSVSNCWDYQARRLSIRYKQSRQRRKDTIDPPGRSLHEHQFKVEQGSLPDASSIDYGCGGDEADMTANDELRHRAACDASANTMKQAISQADEREHRHAELALTENDRTVEAGFCFTLNGSALAVGRTLAALLENHQVMFVVMNRFCEDGAEHATDDVSDISMPHVQVGLGTCRAAFKRWERTKSKFGAHYVFMPFYFECCSLPDHIPVQLDNTFFHSPLRYTHILVDMECRRRSPLVHVCNW